MSLVNDTDNDWRLRKITLFGAARGIVSQLNHGQDLTHISMPAVFLYPYSILELGALRLLNKIHLIYELNEITDPLERMKGICRWFVCLFEQEWQERKPYNPILGETHKSWTEHTKYGKTEIVLEQIMHHPPITAFGVNSTKNQVKVEGNLQFAVEFGGNSLNLTSKGYARVTLGKFGEEYIFSRMWPDMLVTNVIIGTRKHLWQNDVHISCEKSGLSAQFTFYEEQEGYWGEIFNFVEGVIGEHIGDEDAEDIKFIISGKLGDVIHIHPYDSEDQEVFVNCKQVVTTKLYYPPPEEMDEMESLKIWADVNKYVVVDDMYNADAAKLQVEEAQRKKRAERKLTGVEYRPVNFIKDGTIDGWVLSPPPKFPVTCGSLCDANHRPLISIPETATVQEAAETLHQNNILCAPVLNSVDLPLGLVDVLDLLSYIVGISGFFEDISKSPETISQNKLQYSTSPVTSLISASGVNLIWKLERNTPLDLALETFTSGAHRVLVGDPKNLSILTQSHVLKYLWQLINETENANEKFPKINQTLKQLQLGAVAVLLDRPISITTKMTAIEGFRLLYVSKIHGLAIMSEDGKLVGNLSASHLAFLTANRLEDLLLPVLEFKEKIGKADEPLVTCHENSTLKEAIELLVKNHVHRVYIVDHDNRPTGVVSISDVLAQFRD